MSVDKLIEKMRRVREVQAEALGHQFTLRIPNQGELEALHERLSGQRPTFRRFVEACTVGWDMKEIDLIPGGSPVPVEFHPDLFSEWLADHSDAIEPLFGRLSSEMEARQTALDTAEKN